VFIKNRLLRIFAFGLLFIVLYFGLILAVSLFPTIKMVEKSSSSDTSYLYLLEVDGLETKFVSTDNNLNRVDVLFRNPGLDSMDELEISLYDEVDGIVVSKSFSGLNFGDPYYARLDFNRISTSLGKEYTIVIRVKKIVNGKLQLQVGMKDGGVDFIHFYKNDLSLLSSYRMTIERIIGILRFQPIVLLLPLLMVLIFVW